jgi:hypothetical protein
MWQPTSQRNITLRDYPKRPVRSSPLDTEHIEGIEVRSLATEREILELRATVRRQATNLAAQHCRVRPQRVREQVNTGPVPVGARRIRLAREPPRFAPNELRRRHMERLDLGATGRSRRRSSGAPVDAIDRVLSQNSAAASRSTGATVIIST